MRRASRPSVCLVAAVSLLASVTCVSRAAAQPSDAIGVRAQGMAGAFTGVADDASASWWNPAGMAGAAYFNAIIEAATFREPRSDEVAGIEPQRARRADTRSYAVAFPSMGLSYYRVRVSEIRPLTSTDTVPGDRQEGAAAGVLLRSLVLNQFGTSIAQSIGSHLVVGTTVKVVNGGVQSVVLPAVTASLDAATDLDPDGETHAGMDVGAMATLGVLRIGVMVRNAFTEPTFVSGLESFQLTRTARVGGALSSGTRGVIGVATLAFDADLLTTATVLGDERRIAAGGEVWTSGRTFGIRGGWGISTIGLRRTLLSGGVSASVKKGIYADAEYSGGNDLGRKGWAAGLRVTF